MSDPAFLVVRLGSLGDVVHTFPAVSGLRKSFPNSEIVWLTHPKWEFLVQSAALAREVWTVDTRDWGNVRRILARIREHRFQTVIDYQGLWKSAALGFLAGVPQRIGFGSESVREWGVPILYTERVRVDASRHVSDQNGELSARAGAFIPTGEVNLQIPEQDQTVVSARLQMDGIDDYIVLSPGGGWRSKCWPAERYGQLADRIEQELSLRCVLNTGPEESELTAQVTAAAGNAKPHSFVGSLGQLMALLGRAKAVIAGDTGPLHLADAFGAPVVAIFGPTDPARNGPYRKNGVVLRWENAVTSYKRGTKPDESLTHISVDEVMNAVRGLLRPA
jgi:heptosyltransferase-1